ncbi:MAG: response regulator [Spirochaetales bacterium]|nr:response regulator [Spirochaetales bacterium]
MSGQAILCVDDEVIILLSLVQELKNLFGGKYVYERALNATSALKIIDELDHDNIKVILIISDWLMPEIKGDEFLEIVRKKYPHIKSVIVTGQADIKALEKINSNPSVIAVMTKPWNPNQLKDIVSEICV